MFKQLSASVLTIGLLIPQAQAANYFKSNVDVTAIASFSEVRPVNTITNNSLEILTTTNFGGACGSTAYIKASDKHLISTLLTAWSTDQQLDIEVDDTEIKGDKCKVTLVKVVK